MNFDCPYCDQRNPIAPDELEEFGGNSGVMRCLSCGHAFRYALVSVTDPMPEEDEAA